MSDPAAKGSAYFTRLGENRFRATASTGGAWRVDEQHIAPALGLLAHEVERAHAERRADGLVLARLSYDIRGTVPVDVVETAVRVVRAGRTIELVEAVLSHGGRDVLVLRAWLVQTRPVTTSIGTTLTSIPGPQSLDRWDPTTIWPGGFIDSVEIRRQQREPGRAVFWARTELPLVDTEPVSRLARTVGLLDIANGMTVRADPRELAFPNLDLTAHLFIAPRSEWVGFDTSVSFAADGIGLTHSVIHDEHGPIGASSQILTLRPV